jgi:hypothetical protein
MLEGVREWGRALSVCSLFSALGSRRRTVADSPLQHHPVRPGQDAKFAQGTTPPACLDWGHGGVGGRHCLGVAHARFPSTWPECAIAPGPPHQVSRQPSSTQRRSFADIFSPPFCTHVQSSVVAAACSGPKKLSAGSVRQQAATPAQQGKQGTPFAGDAI